MSGANPQAAVFLDRDGTLIREIGHLHRAEQVEILPGVALAIRMLREAGFKMVVVTNQSAVARGLLTEMELREIHALLRERLAVDGAILDAIYYCPHHPTEGAGAYRVICNCRKPNPGMIYRAASELAIDPGVSYVIGDQAIDMELAARVGAQGILLQTNDAPVRLTSVSPFTVVEDLREAAKRIVAFMSQTPAKEIRS
jgi:D-glycero-D-manno-heptose 1,7-bisphosphate phosphatase